jgi:hypothetical protein
MAAIARDKLLNTKPTNDAIATSLNSILAERSAANRLKDAAALLAEFETTPDETIRLTAETFRLAYGTLATQLEASIAIWEKLAVATTEAEIKALVPETGRALSTIDEAWRVLPLATAALSHALVDSKREVNGKLGYLRITRAERAQLIQALTKAFPNAKGTKGGGDFVPGPLTRSLAGPQDPRAVRVARIASLARCVIRGLRPRTPDTACRAEAHCAKAGSLARFASTEYSPEGLCWAA